MWFIWRMPRAVKKNVHSGVVSDSVDTKSFYLRMWFNSEGIFS